MKAGKEEILCYFDTGDFGWCETEMEDGDYDYESVPWGYCSFHCQLPYTKYGHSLFGTDVRYSLTRQGALSLDEFLTES